MPDRDGPAAYGELCAAARSEAENFGACYEGAAQLFRDLADAIEHLTGTETVRLVHPDGGRVVVALPVDVEIFAKVCTALAKGGFDFDRPAVEALDV